jgi:hypothetical protein
VGKGKGERSLPLASPVARRDVEIGAGGRKALVLGIGVSLFPSDPPLLSDTPDSIISGISTLTHGSDHISH